MLNNNTSIAQAQLQLIEAQVGLKQYAADWLKEAKVVTRDASGKFASQNQALFKKEPLGINERSELLGNISPESVIQVEQALQTLDLDTEKVFLAIQREQNFTQAQRNRLANQDPIFPDRPNTLMQRVMELPALAAQQNNPSKVLELQWHQAIIQSEVRYGDLIDRVLEKDPWDNPPFAVTAKVFGAGGFGSSYNVLNIGDEENSPSATRRAYKQLMKRLTKPKNRINTSLITEEIIRKAQELSGEEGKKSVFFMGKGATPEADALINRRIKEVIKSSKEFGKLINVDIPDVYVGLFALGLVVLGKPVQIMPHDIGFVLAGYSPQHTLVNAGFIGIPKVLIFHELGHALEKAANLTPMTWNYIDSRQKEKTPFPYAYTSKKYGKVPEQGNSELISTATQMLTSSRDLHRAAVLDREHLMIGLYALDKKNG